MKSCPSHCETSATRQSLRKLRRERIRKGRAPAGFASKPLRNCNLKNLETLLLEPLKTMKSCPSHCETSATRQSLRKLRRERIRKGRAPAGFASKPLRNCNLKNLETLLLEPLKTMKSCPSHCETAATRQSPRKLRRERIRKTLRLEPLKTMKSCPSHCETSATRQSLRKLRRERIRKGRAPAGFASKPLRNCNLKNLETLLLEPLKTMKSYPSHCETAATRQSPRKLRRERIRKGRASAGFASKPLQECSLKNLETLLLEPLKTMKSSPIKTMKTCLSHCVAFGTPKNTQAIRKHSQKNADALLLEPTKKNKESIPKPLRNFSHQAKPKKKVIDLRNQRRTTNSGTKTLAVRNIGFVPSHAKQHETLFYRRAPP